MVVAVVVPTSDRGLLLGCLCGLLGLHELGVVDVAVPVLVVAVEDRVDHVDELLVLEDLGLRHLLPAVVIVVRTVCMGKRRNFSVY